MQYDGSIRIDTNINPNSIPSYEINTESIKKSMEMLNGRCDRFEKYRSVAEY